MERSMLRRLLKTLRVHFLRLEGHSWQNQIMRVFETEEPVPSKIEEIMV